MLRRMACQIGWLIGTTHLALAQNAGEGFDLRLSGLSRSKFDMSHATISLALGLMVIALYAAALSIFYVRARRLWNEHDEAQNRTIRDAQMRIERANLFLAADRQLLIAWGGSGETPEFAGDTGLVQETTNPLRILSFSEWLPADDAKKLDRALLHLQTEGAAFSQSLRTLQGEYIEIEGRPISGRAVLRLRVATGERLALARERDEKNALEAAQSVLQSVLNAIPQPVWLRDRAGNLGWVNTAYAQAVEAPDPQAALSRQSEFLDSDDRAAIRKSQGRDGRYHGAMTAIVAGQRRKVDVVEVLGPQGGGGFALDISELEAARQALERQMDAHVRTLDELPSAVAIFDQHQQLAYANRAFRDLFSIDPAFLASSPTNAALLDRLRTEGRLPEEADFRHWKAELLAQYAASETTERGWNLPNGRALRVVISPNPQGGLTYLFEDETERFTLATSYDRLKNTQWETLMALSEGVGVFGSDGHLQLSNPAFGNLWGIAPATLEDNPHVETIAQACQADGGAVWRDLSALICSVSDTRQDQSFETVRDNGRVLSISTTPLPDGATLVTTADVTDTIEAERRLREHNEALRQAARLRTDFIKSVSFELRSPLTSVVGLAQALAEGVAGPLNTRQQTYAEDLVRASDAVLALTNDILDLGSIETGAMELIRSDVDIGRAIEEATEGLKDRLGDAKIKLALNVATGIGTIKADPKRLRHIVFNLLANAVAFSEPGDTVRLVVRKAEAGITLDIHDPGKGPGLARGMASSSSSIPDVERENGLRFALAKALVQLHGGRLTHVEETDRSHVAQVWLPSQ